MLELKKKTDEIPMVEVNIVENKRRNCNWVKKKKMLCRFPDEMCRTDWTFERKWSWCNCCLLGMLMEKELFERGGKSL